MTFAPMETSRLTAIQAEAVRTELRAILKSHFFSSSKRCQDLLEFVVTNALEGNFDNLTERIIGSNVFGRPIEYETATDAIVRVRANDVRRRLTEYYSELKVIASVRIVLNSGSYVPEFNFSIPPQAIASSPIELSAEEKVLDHASDVTEQENPGWFGVLRSRRWMLGAVVLLGCALMLVAGVLLRRALVPSSPVDAFWAPVLHSKSEILICAGGNTFLQNPVPGFFTAGKEIDYPYFSLQTVVSTTLLSTLIERHGAAPQFRFAAITSLPEFHEYPIILLNAYNNQWTLRLTEPLRFHFSPIGSRPQTIMDGQNMNTGWHRDSALAYENSDDYALMARFWDRSTDNWVVVLAGLGRNGTEAATRFAVDAHYMQELRNRVGRDFASLNMEVVLRVSVVDGKTGVPQIVAIHVW